ncbi:hypothetical protein [Pseudarthrobacter sp. J47]|uniref:hypothetical protein n=1 Tax=Pseudarthrobacter sp. J47 TaxID=3116482 RepID=UPI002E815BA2|nr:hypothetical protein [Pseudarthrobacter sp. J47]MEE2524535.1 hypothetical protein [Pseudarthrobacter sp. J47]
MNDSPDLSKSPRRPRPAADSGVHPAEAGQEASKPAPAVTPAATSSVALGADGLPVKPEKEAQRPLSTYVGQSTRDLIDQVVHERKFTIREVVELAVKNYWGQGK